MCNEGADSHNYFGMRIRHGQYCGEQRGKVSFGYSAICNDGTVDGTCQITGQCRVNRSSGVVTQIRAIDGGIQALQDAICNVKDLTPTREQYEAPRKAQQRAATVNRCYRLL